MSVSLTHRGLNYHTKPMPRDRAENFSRCLTANGRFTRVSVEPSRSAGKWVVYYQPASDERHGELLQVEQGRREEKARTEGQAYLFLRDERFWWCLSASGETYETTEHTCTCADATWRTGPLGLRCKHSAALACGAGERIERAQVFGGRE